MMQRPVVFFGKAPVHVEPRERALDNPAPSVGAGIDFPHQYVRRFLDPDAYPSCKINSNSYLAMPSNLPKPAKCYCAAGR